MQPPKNRFQILILHPKRHSYIQYKEINIHFLMPIAKLKKMPFWTKGDCQKQTEKSLF